MRRVLALIAVVALVGAALAVPAFADQGSDSVTATVTPGTVAISLRNFADDADVTTFTYGTLALSTSNAVRSTGNPSECGAVGSAGCKAKNTGTVSEDFYIKGAEATFGGETTWALAATVTANQYVHQFTTDSGSSFTDMSTANTSLSSGVATGGTTTFHAEIAMPTSTTGTSQRTTSVTITAVEAGGGAP